MHSFSTSTVFVQLRRRSPAGKEITNKFRPRSNICTGLIQMVLRIIPLLWRFFIGPVELVDAQGVASDDQAVCFDQNRGCF
jgi:hypothetical protein